MSEERTVVGQRWYHTAEDLQLTIGCDGSTHRLRWHRGQIEMLDHPNPGAERALVALGGGEPSCLAMDRLWRLAVADGGFLEEWVDDTHLTNARLSWLAMALERLRNEGFHEFLRSLPPDRAEPMGRFLHSFPRPWLDRAAAEVAEAALDGAGVVCGHAESLIDVAIAQRVRRAFVAAIGQSHLTLGAAALVPLTVTIDQDPDQNVAGESGAAMSGALRGPGRGVSVVVGRDWLHRVWAAGAGVIDGCLVLTLDSGDVDGAAADVVLARWRDGDPVLCHHRASHDGRDWGLFAPAPDGPQ